jgi:hypothetical protein
VLSEGLHFLGGFGVREISGLRVAFLSGRYDAEIYNAQALGGAGPAFVGVSYTPVAIERLVELAQEPGKPPIDVLLTSEWPAHIEQRMLDSEKPQHPDGQVINWDGIAAAPIASLCARIEPRYHMFGSGDMFYQRPPFQTPSKGHVCRCIGLGSVGSKGKGRLWIHGLQLSPAATMPEVVLKQRPENTTPCPFLVPGAAGDAESAAGAPEKRNAADTQDAEAAVIPNEVFLGGLPPNMTEQRIKKALDNCGKIERVSLARDGPDGPCKGFGFVTFSTEEGAQNALDLHDMLETGKGRKISINLAKERSGGAKKRKIEIVIEPHHDCWFCLVNPSVEKHMIVTATTDVYVAVARGAINPLHVLVLPVKHAPSFAACPPELQQRLQAHVIALREMCRDKGQECIVWERWLPQGMSSANHMMIQVLPIDGERAAGAVEALESVGERSLPGAKFKRVNAHSDVVEHLKDDPSTPFIYFELPGDKTAKGRQIERYVYAGGAGGPRIPVSFGRQVACQLLGCMDKVEWKQCQEDPDVEKRHSAALRERFKRFQPLKAKG